MVKGTRETIEIKHFGLVVALMYHEKMVIMTRPPIDREIGIAVNDKTKCRDNQEDNSKQNQHVNKRPRQNQAAKFLVSWDMSASGLRGNRLLENLLHRETIDAY